MPCQASAKTGVIVAQLCWYTVPYVSSSYAACIHARYVRVYARTNAHACMHASSTGGRGEKMGEHEERGVGETMARCTPMRSTRNPLPDPRDFVQATRKA